MCVKLERMPLVVVIRGQTIQFPVVGAQMALATFMTDDSTCSVGKGGEPTRSTPGGKQIQRYDAAAMHPFRFQIKGQEVEMLCKSFALAKTCNRVSSPSGDTVDIFAPGRDSWTRRRPSSQCASNNLGPPRPPKCAGAVLALRRAVSPQPPGETKDQVPANGGVES